MGPADPGAVGLILGMMSGVVERARSAGAAGRRWRDGSSPYVGMVGIDGILVAFRPATFDRASS